MKFPEFQCSTSSQVNVVSYKLFHTILIFNIGQKFPIPTILTMLSGENVQNMTYEIDLTENLFYARTGAMKLVPIPKILKVQFH